MIVENLLQSSTRNALKCHQEKSFLSLHVKRAEQVGGGTVSIKGQALEDLLAEKGKRANQVTLQPIGTMEPIFTPAGRNVTFRSKRENLTKY